MLQARTLLAACTAEEARKRDPADYALALRLSSQPIGDSLASRFVGGQLRLCVYFDGDSSRELVQVRCCEA